MEWRDGKGPWAWVLIVSEGIWIGSSAVVGCLPEMEDGLRQWRRGFGRRRRWGGGCPDRKRGWAIRLLGNTVEDGDGADLGVGLDGVPTSTMRAGLHASSGDGDTGVGNRGRPARYREGSNGAWIWRGFDCRRGWERRSVVDCGGYRILEAGRVEDGGGEGSGGRANGGEWHRWAWLTGVGNRMSMGLDGLKVAYGCSAVRGGGLVLECGRNVGGNFRTGGRGSRVMGSVAWGWLEMRWVSVEGLEESLFSGGLEKKRRNRGGRSREEPGEEEIEGKRIREEKIGREEKERSREGGKKRGKRGRIEGRRSTEEAGRKKF